MSGLPGLSGVEGRAQQQTPPGPATPVFRSGTRLIVENVTVKDKSGTPVEGLTAKDFSITEDGEAQAITFVEFQRLATPAIPAAKTGSDPLFLLDSSASDKKTGSDPISPAPFISSTPDGAIRYRDRRLVVLYFDATAMPPNDQMRAYSAAQKFIDAQMDPSVL